MSLPEDLARLDDLGLRPPARAGDCAVPEPGEGLRERYRGCLLGGAVGDALGRPVEGWRSRHVWKQFPDGLRDFQPWREWYGGPRGTFTDDTQLTIEMAEWLIDAGQDPPSTTDVARRISLWGRTGRGIGQATWAALVRMERGEPWWRSGEPSAGNGAAMRAAPYALRHAGRFEEIRQTAALGTVPTHADASAVASAIAQAVAVNECLAANWPLDQSAFLERVVGAIDDLDLPALAHRGTGERATLVQRIGQVEGLLEAEPGRVFDHFYNGAFVLETTPVVLWCLLARGEDPEEALVTAVMGGGDADTVAAILGNLIGALHGLAAFPDRWVGEDLEDRDRLVALADALYDLRWG